MGRPRTPIGTFGEISFVKVAGGQVQARTRFRDDDGQVRRVSATGVSRQEAERNLKKVLAQRASHVASVEITADSSFAKLVAVWLADLDLENKLAPSTRALYERNRRQLVMPAFEHYLLREITVRQVDQFITTLAATKSYSMAKQHHSVAQAAVAGDGLDRDPGRCEIRKAVRSWRRDGGLSGPKPDGQLEQIIEAMLGTSARIGEVLAIRKCAVDVTSSPGTVRLCGTIVSPGGKPTHRQDHPKTSKSTRTVSVPSFTGRSSPSTPRRRLKSIRASEAAYSPRPRFSSQPQSKKNWWLSPTV